MYVNILCVLFLGEWFDFSSLFINRWPNWFNKSLGFETIKRWNYRNSALKSVSNTVFPHIVSAETILFWIQPYVLWPLVTVHTGAETIEGRKLFKGGNYMRKYGNLFWYWSPMCYKIVSTERDAFLKKTYDCSFA